MTCSRWFRSSSAPKAVALLAHGMNVKPVRMDELAQALASQGVDAYRVGFSGHCGEPSAFRNLRVADLKRDALEFHSEAGRRARELGVPLHLVAFSFSATLYTLLQEEAPFDRRVFFAPAFATRSWYPIAMLLRFLPHGFPIPSVVPDDYRANSNTGASCLQVLHELLKTWKKTGLTSSGAPTLIFIHPKDELIPASAIQAMIHKRGFKDWEMVEVRIEGATHPRPQAHRIIDETSVGVAQWSAIRGRISEFFA